METHKTHRTRISLDASTYDEICDLCGKTDRYGSIGDLAYPCPANDEERVKYDNRIKEKK